MEKNQEFKERHEELKQLHKEWRDISLTQLSNVNNILIGLSSGLIAYFITKQNNSKIEISLSLKIDWSLTIFWLGIIMLGISICYGVAVLLSRLYDFRISRHIALTRQRYYKTKKMELSREDFEDFTAFDRVESFLFILFKKLPRITTSKIDNADITKEFDELRRLSKVLGTCTWRWTKVQLLLFIISGILIFIYHLALP